MTSPYLFDVEIIKNLDESNNNHIIVTNPGTASNDFYMKVGLFEDQAFSQWAASLGDTPTAT